jgi:hypothetical protein
VIKIESSVTTTPGAKRSLIQVRMLSLDEVSNLLTTWAKAGAINKDNTNPKKHFKNDTGIPV